MPDELIPSEDPIGGLDCQPAAKLHHVGIIVADEAQAQAFIELFGLTIARRYYVERYQAECIFTSGPGGVIELIVPGGGTLQKFNRGLGGVHHVALQVPDLRAFSRQLAKRGVELLEAEPVEAGPIWINFLPPSYTRGIIVELVEER